MNVLAGSLRPAQKPEVRSNRDVDVAQGVVRRTDIPGNLDLASTQRERRCVVPDHASVQRKHLMGAKVRMASNMDFPDQIQMVGHDCQIIGGRTQVDLVRHQSCTSLEAFERFFDVQRSAIDFNECVPVDQRERLPCSSANRAGVRNRRGHVAPIHRGTALHGASVRLRPCPNRQRSCGAVRRYRAVPHAGRQGHAQPIDGDISAVSTHHATGRGNGRCSIGRHRALIGQETDGASTCRTAACIRQD